MVPVAAAHAVAPPRGAGLGDGLSAADAAVTAADDGRERRRRRDPFLRGLRLPPSDGLTDGAESVCQKEIFIKFSAVRVIVSKMVLEMR